jgi:hypothetical protein
LISKQFIIRQPPIIWENFMEAKYVEAIKAGIIGGVLLAVLALISQLASILGYINVEDYTSDPGAALALGLGAAISCCICLLYIVVLAGTGALAVKMTNLLLRDLNDAVMVSAVSGAVAGIIWGGISIVLSMLGELIKGSGYGVAGRIGGSLFSGICGLICCLPGAAIIGIVIAVVGGAIYWAVILKK